MGLELNMEENRLASWYISDSDGNGSLYYYDISTQRWIGHPKQLPESIDNPYLGLSDGYMVYIDAELKVTIIGR
jgi:hypothetical protein